MSSNYSDVDQALLRQRIFGWVLAERRERSDELASILVGLMRWMGTVAKRLSLSASGEVLAGAARIRRRSTSSLVVMAPCQV
jgi:hypothetical protein